MLHRALEHDGSGKGKDIGSLALTAALVVGVVELIERRTSEVHRTHGVADERMDAGVLCLGITHALREMKVLAGKHCLGSGKGWIHAFPTAWQGAAMEDDEKPIVVGVGENVFVELHHRLLVATEEVYLYATNAYALHPCHLLTTRMRLVHQVAWALRSVVPCSVAVIPEIQRHTLRLAVACQFGYLFAHNIINQKTV